MTLERFLASTGIEAPLASVLLTAARAGVAISEELRSAGLLGETGVTGGTNVQGEAVKKMDLKANEILVEAYQSAEDAAMAASEEMENPIALAPEAPYSVVFDPLDGSSNVDTGGSVGSIISIQSAPPREKREARSLLQKGSLQRAACYLNYGPATTLVIAAGGGTHLFCLDSKGGEFHLTARDWRIPRRGKVYAVNEGQRAFFHPATRKFLDHLQLPDKAEGRPYSTRYSGCLVTDVHRILLEGGIYLYPSDTRDPKKPHGKLRLLYECAPLALIVEQAGGRASTGRGPILEVQPKEIHERVPLFIGSPLEVSLAEDFEAGRG